MLYYIPLESYKERYTFQWSAPKTGWLERNWIKYGLEYHRIDGDVSSASPKQNTIQSGCVLDATGRSMYCFSQMTKLLQMLKTGQIGSDDVIYFDDFWHPGIEALPYAFHLLNVHPKMYAFLHAQSVDEFDFTHPMRKWMRHFEKGIGEVLTGIFVCGPFLQRLVVDGGIAPIDKVHVTGHPFCSEEVKERMTLPVWERDREDNVVFSSRWDSEKNPKFFLQVAETVVERRPYTRFIICTSAPKLRSNDPSNLDALHQSCEKYPDNIILMENLTKEKYYAELQYAKIQMNTASQDFVAITLLESSVAGCYPVYPFFRSFPETLRYDRDYMYQHLNLESAAEKVMNILDRDDLWTRESIESRAWIHERFDSAWERQLKVMRNEPIDDPYEVSA